MQRRYLAACSFQAGAASGRIWSGIGQSTIKDTSTGDFDLRIPRSRCRRLPVHMIRSSTWLSKAAIPISQLSQTVGGQNMQFKLHGYNAAGLLIFPLGPIDLYGKAGVIS